MKKSMYAKSSLDRACHRLAADELVMRLDENTTSIIISSSLRISISTDFWTPLCLTA